MTNMPFSFLMMIALQKADLYCWEWVINLEFWLLFIANEEKRWMPFGLFLLVRQQGENVTSIKVTLHEKRVWFFKNEIAQKSLCEQIEEVSHYSPGRGCHPILQGYGRRIWRALSKPHQFVSSRLCPAATKGRYPMAGSALIGKVSWRVLHGHQPQFPV